MKSGMFGKTKLKIEMEVEIEILGEKSLFMVIFKILPFSRHPEFHCSFQASFRIIIIFSNVSCCGCGPCFKTDIWVMISFSSHIIK